jgi:hypothetical protein
MYEINDDIFDQSMNEQDSLYEVNSFESVDAITDNLLLESFDDLDHESCSLLDIDDLGSIQDLDINDSNLIGNEKLLSEQHETEILNDHQSNLPFFTGKYSDSEINSLKQNVSDCEYTVNNLKSEVHHHEVLVDLSKGKSDYADEVSDLNNIKSEYNDAFSKLNNAKAKLNNAL